MLLINPGKDGYKIDKTVFNKQPLVPLSVGRITLLSDRSEYQKGG